MNPTFCTYRDNPQVSDAYFADVAAAHGLGGRRPGLAVGSSDGCVEVIVAVDGSVAQIPGSLVDTVLPTEVILALMDAIEEAIEDAIESEPRDERIVARLEANLALMERAFDGA
jgi:hypothetical protein